MTNINFLFIILYGCTAICSGQISRNIDAYVQPLIKNQDFYGVILVSKNDSITHLKGYGYADLEWMQKNSKEKIFHIASLTKQFTAAAILIAEQKKLLSIKDPLAKYFPEFKNGNKILIEHLLAQRSGIPDYNELERYTEMSLKESTLSEVIDWFKNEPLLFEPGMSHNYSNSNFILAARIIEIVSKDSYSEFLRKNIFDPLSLTQTGNYKFTDIIKNRASGYDPAPDGLINAPYYNKSFKMGSGSLYSSVLDLYKWDRALYNTSILTQESIEKLFKDYGNNYGLGWGVYENNDVGRFASHDGKSPGFFAYMKRYMNKDKIVIIILSNVNSGIMNNMKKDITNIVFHKDFTIYNSYEIQPTPKNLNPYTGKYDFPPKFNFTIVEKDGELFFQWMDTPFLQYLTPVGEDRFLMRSRYDYLKFVKDEKGMINSIEYIQKSDTTNCPRI